MHLKHLPPYSHAFSAVEPIWTDVKHHEMPERRFQDILALRASAEAALQRKAARLLAARRQPAASLRAGA